MSSPVGDGSPIPVEAEPEVDEAAASVPLDDIPMALPAPAPAPPANPRRLPPPCWSHDETVALIDAYRDKWYALRRGNLKANHWQEVADAVGRKCPGASPAKTAVQCRHKMEKLRKRYRTEIQRAKSMPVSRFSSSWVHFKRMDSMEKGPQEPDKRAAAGYNSDSDGAEDNDEEDDDDPGSFLGDGMGAQGGAYLTDGYKNGGVYAQNRKLFNRNGAALGPPMAAAGGFRIRIPTGVSIAQPAPVAPSQKFYSKVNLGNPGLVACAGSNMKANFGGGAKVLREEAGKKRERDPMEEMVAAVKLLGDGFVRMEQMKMEMAREMETMRMEMEMKRTQMILDSQQRIVEAFAKAFLEKKRKKQQQQMQHQPQDLPKKAPSPPDS